MSDDVVAVRAAARTTLDKLARLAAPVLRAAGAERAVAFGSFARGTADGFSDLDLAVVLPTDLLPIERGNLLRALFEALPVGLDLLVYTPDEFARVRALVERLEPREAPLDALLDAARELDLLYVPTRYPNGLASGTPGQAFSTAQSMRALDLAARFIDAASRTVK